MAISPAAKVGVVTLASIVALGAGVAWLTSFSFVKHGYLMTVTFGDVAGLLPGAKVMLMGVKVGKVEAIEPSERLVHLRVHIDSPSTHILEHSRFKIASQGIIGDKDLNIFPPKLEESAPQYVQANETVRGDDPTRLELVMDELTDTFNELRKTTDPKKLQAFFNQTAKNLYETSNAVRQVSSQAQVVMGNVGGTVRHVDGLIGNVDRLVGAARPAEVSATVSDLRNLSRGLLATYGGIFGNAPGQAGLSADNAKALKSIRSLANQLDKLATTLNVTAGDPKLQHDIKDTINNIKLLTASVTGAAAMATKPSVLGEVAGLQISPRLDGLATHTPAGTGFAGNLGVRVSFPSNYLEFGLEQVGEGPYFDLDFGSEKVYGNLGYQFGLVRSKIGVGIDYALTDSLTLTGQLFDPIHPTARLGSLLFPLAGSQYGLLAQYARSLGSNDNYIWLGVEWRPLASKNPK